MPGGMKARFAGPTSRAGGLDEPARGAYFPSIMRYNRSARNLTNLILVALVTCAGAHCGPKHHAQQVQSGLDGDRLTLGTVQREVRVGMSSAEVAEAIGSPNVVTTDEAGREVWVYDKFATDVVTSESGWSIFGIGAGFGHSGGGLAGGGTSGHSGATSTSQRTLTIVIKFDEQHKVRDFAYHASRF